MTSTAPDTTTDAWREFANQIATVARVAHEDVQPKSRLIEDLALDSLALTEVVVFVIETYDPLPFLQRLEGRTWEGVTVGELFYECMAEERARR